MPSSSLGESSVILATTTRMASHVRRTQSSAASVASASYRNKIRMTSVPPTGSGSGAASDTDNTNKLEVIVIEAAASDVEDDDETPTGLPPMEPDSSGASDSPKCFTFSMDLSSCNNPVEDVTSNCIVEVKDEAAASMMTTVRKTGSCGRPAFQSNFSLPSVVIHSASSTPTQKKQKHHHHHHRGRSREKNDSEAVKKKTPAKRSQSFHVNTSTSAAAAASSFGKANEFVVRTAPVVVIPRLELPPDGDDEDDDEGCDQDEVVGHGSNNNSTIVRSGERAKSGGSFDTLTGTSGGCDHHRGGANQTTSTSKNTSQPQSQSRPQIHIQYDPQPPSSDNQQQQCSTPTKRKTRKRRKSLVNLFFPPKNNNNSNTNTNVGSSTDSLDRDASPVPLASPKPKKRAPPASLNLLSATSGGGADGHSPSSSGGQRLHFRRLSDIICRLTPKEKAPTSSKDDSDIGGGGGITDSGKKGGTAADAATPSAAFLKQLFPHRRRRSSVTHLDNTEQFRETKEEYLEASRRRMSSFPPCDGDESAIILEKIHYLSSLEPEQTRCATPVSASMSPLKLFKRANLLSAGDSSPKEGGGASFKGGKCKSSSDIYNHQKPRRGSSAGQALVNFMSRGGGAGGGGVAGERDERDEDKTGSSGFLAPTLPYSHRRSSSPLVAELSALQREAELREGRGATVDRPGVVVFPKRKVEDVPGIFIPGSSKCSGSNKAVKDDSGGDFGSRLSSFLGVNRPSAHERRRHSVSDPLLLQQQLTTAVSAHAHAGQQPSCSAQQTSSSKPPLISPLPIKALKSSKRESAQSR